MRHGTVSLIGFIFCMLCWMCSSVEAVPILSFDVSNSTPDISDIFTVDVVVTDVTDIFAFNIDVGFDSTILSVNTVAPGAFLGSGGGLTLGGLGLFGFNTATPGEIQDINDSLLGLVPGVTGSGVLATITFTALSNGLSALDFLNVNSLAGTEALNSIGAPIIFTGASSADVNVIPEPGTLLLLLIGCGLFIALTQTRRYTRRTIS